MYKSAILCTTEARISWGGGLDGHIFEKIISLENLLLAWREFKRGKISKIDVQEFYFNLENNLFDLRKQLLTGNYRPSKYGFFYVRDPKLRPIHKAIVKDRVVFQAVFRVLYHIFDKHFIYDSYACRFDKGTHLGVERLRRFVNKCSQNNSRSVFVLKCDIKKFFYSIDHQILLGLIKEKIKDERLLNLIKVIIDSFHISPGKGLPLGNVTSQLFANIYLNELDQFVKHILKEKYYIRYCDDFVFVSDDRQRLENLVLVLNNFLREKLKFVLHPNKIEIRKLSQGIDFLGYVTLPYHRVLRTKTKRRMFKRINKNNEESYFGILKHCSGEGIKFHLETLLSCDFDEI